MKRDVLRLSSTCMKVESLINRNQDHVHFCLGFTHIPVMLFMVRLKVFLSVYYRTNDVVLG
jgi:hypothetical protein